MMLERYRESLAWPRIVVLISVSATMLCARTAYAMPQIGGAPAIRVESGEVLVPTTVFSSRTNGLPVFGLTASDFRLFEDGKEQNIQKVVVEKWDESSFIDNFGVEEYEEASASGQKWVLVLRKPLPTPFFAASGDSYVLAYMPPPSAEGSCHRITVKTRDGGYDVYARDEYCSVPHPPSDPLAGTSLSNEMDRVAGSDDTGRIPLALQAGYFYGNANEPRVYVTAEFSGGSIRDSKGSFGRGYRTEIVAIAHKRGLTAVARSSDSMFIGTGPYSTLFIPDHHETQMQLAPGDYDIQVVLSDGSNFGKAESRLTVPPVDGKHLSISSIFLCKQFHIHRPFQADSAGLTSTLSDFLPLVSMGREFTPTADASFRQKDILFAYHEVLEPLLMSTPTTTVQTRLKIFNAATGESVTDTGWQSVERWIEPGKPWIHIASEITLKKFGRGSYRIEIQAADSTGTKTDVGTAGFGIR